MQCFPEPRPTSVFQPPVKATRPKSAASQPGNLRRNNMPLACGRGILCRVDAISRILSVADGGIIYLGSASPPTSSGAPGAFCGAGRSTAPVSPCSRWGLPGHRHYCRCRRALTAPFHPRSVSAALCSLLHLPSGCPARPLTGIVALWSADFPRQAHDLPRFPRSTRRLYCNAKPRRTASHRRSIDRSMAGGLPGEERLQRFYAQSLKPMQRM